MSDETRTIPADVAPMPDGAVRLPSGGWALLSDESAYTGADRKMIRKALNEDGMGDMLSVAYAAALAVRITSWSIPNRANLQTPRWDVKMLDIIPGGDLEALEDLVGRWARQIVGVEAKGDARPVEGDGPGSPQQPADE